MFDRQSLHIALLMWGCIFNLIAALCMFMSKNFDKQKRKWMLCMQLSSAVLLGSDAVAWAFRGVSGQTGYLMVRISNFLVFALSDVMLLLFHGYVCCYLFEKVKPGKRQNLRIKAVYLIALTGIFLVVLSQFTHFYYYFDADNFYHRNPAYVLSSIIPMAGLLLDYSDAGTGRNFADSPAEKIPQTAVTDSGYSGGTDAALHPVWLVQMGCHLHHCGSSCNDRTHNAGIFPEQAVRKPQCIRIL